MIASGPRRFHSARGSNVCRSPGKHRGASLSNELNEGRNLEFAVSLKCADMSSLPILLVLPPDILMWQTKMKIFVLFRLFLSYWFLQMDFVRWYFPNAQKYLAKDVNSNLPIANSLVSERRLIIQNILPPSRRSCLPFCFHGFFRLFSRVGEWYTCRIYCFSYSENI